MYIDLITCGGLILSLIGIMLTLCIAQGYFLYECHQENQDMKTEIYKLKQQIDHLSDRLQSDKLVDALLARIERD
jgi:hypothetical protein